MNCYYGVDFEAKRKELLKSDVAQSGIKEIIERADNCLNEEYKALKITEYMLFIETGDRKIFEKEYFRRRNNCAYISVAYWLTRDEKYKEALTNLIFHICDEYTWSLPAHSCLEIKPSSEFVIGVIDLFSAETARLLTDIFVSIGDCLPYYVKDRIEYEIRRRIIIPLTKRDYGWHHDDCTNNWASVCASGCTVAVLQYATEEEKEKIMPVLNSAMENYLSGFNDDGCCLEGCSYWVYGFGYYLIYAMAMLEYSGGEVNLFDNDKVRKIALYLQNVRMGKTKVVSFSDGSDEFLFSPGILSLLRKMYGEEVFYPPLKYGKYNGNVFSVKELLWLDTEYKEDKEKFNTTFFKQSQWYVKQSANYSFAAKGGHNDEPHNHNDVGSFMIVTSGDDTPLADLGMAVYRKETFDPKYRYTLLNNSSWGHSVPIINGKYQLEGKNYKAENVNAGDDFFEADIACAYEDGLISGIKRRFELKEKSIFFSDLFVYSDKTEDITERFVSCTKPEICDGYIDLKSMRILFDKEKYSVDVSGDSFRNHANTADIKVYFIDFKSKTEGESRFEFEFALI